MRHCKECGQKAEKNDLKYCVNCGAALDSLEKAQGTATNKPPRKPLTKRQKFITIISSGVIVLLIGLYFIGAHFTSHERLVKNFSQAVDDGDAKKLAKILTFHKSDEKISASDVEGFLIYLEDDPDITENMIDSLHEQSELLDGKNKQPSNKEEFMETFLSSGNTGKVMLEKGDGFLLYDTYELTIEPAYVTLNTNVEGTKLFAGEKEIAKADSVAFSFEHGPLLPGVYTFRAESEAEDIDLSKEEQTKITSTNSNVDLNLDATYISFDVPFEADLESRVLLNDRKVDFNIFKGEDFGPVALDESTNIAVEVDFPWGTMTSVGQPLDRNEIPVSFKVDKKMQESLTEALQDHVDLYLASWLENDITKLSHLSDELQKEYQSEFDSDHYSADNNYGFDKQVFSMLLDTKNAQIDFSTGNYYLSTIIKENGKSKLYDQYDGIKEHNDNKEFEYKFLYDKKNWTVYDKNANHSGLSTPVELDVSTDLVTLGSTDEAKTSSAEVSDDSSDDSGTAAEAEEVTLDYVYQMVEAINGNDYEQVEPYIKNGSELHDMQSELVDKLNDSGMMQEVINATVVDVEEKDEKWIVTTDETIKLIYESGKEETKDYTWKYTVEDNGDDMVLSDIE